VELALVSLGIETVLVEAVEDFLDVCQMLFWVVGVDEDVIQVDNYRDINHIGEDVIHEPLESSWGIGEPFGHDQPLEGSVVGLECHFPLVPGCDAHQVVRMPEVNLCIDSCLAWGI